MHCWGLALADFGRDACSSDSLSEKQPIFFCFVLSGSLNNARFH